jgi:hypothetical protein
MNNTFSSTIFNETKSKDIPHKTNLGHRKDHSTNDLFGEYKMEPVKK